MFPRRKLAALALLAAAVGCTDHDPPSPTEPDGAGTGPEAAAHAPGASAEVARLERQARRLARALDDPGFRQYLQAQLQESPIVEHKLHFQRLLSRDGGRALTAQRNSLGNQREMAVSGWIVNRFGVDIKDIGDVGVTLQ